MSGNGNPSHWVIYSLDAANARIAEPRYAHKQAIEAARSASRNAARPAAVVWHPV